MFLFLAVTLFITVLFAVSRPLIWGPPPEAGGEGLEVSQAGDLWHNEKNRLLDLVRENDLALIESRIDAQHHEEVALQLSEEAEVVVDRLRQIRSHFADPSDGNQRRIMLPFSAGGLIAVGLAAFGINIAASVNDIDMTISPHATGQIPIEDGQADNLLPPVMPSMMEDGETPDIEAMVARLEERVYGDEPTEDDIRMLLRSYRVMERSEDALYVLGLAGAQFPDNVEFKMLFLRGMLQQPDFEPSTELVTAVDDVIRLQPELYEAHWYRGLLQAREGKLADARKTLMWLRPRLAERPDAMRAVDSLLAELSTQSDVPTGIK